MVGRIFECSNIEYSNIENSKFEYSGTRVLEKFEFYRKFEYSIFIDIDIYIDVGIGIGFGIGFDFSFDFRYQCRISNIEYPIFEYSSTRVLENSLTVRVTSELLYARLRSRQVWRSIDRLRSLTFTYAIKLQLEPMDLNV